MLFESIDKFLIHNKDECICFCVANNAVSEMVKNLLYSAKLVELELVLFALDEDIVESCKDICTIVKYYDPTVISNRMYDFKSKDFKSVIWQRFVIGNEILKHNKKFIYIDTDIVIKRNFLQDILEKYNDINLDCVFQSSGDKDLCTGFFSMRPTEKTLMLNNEYLIKRGLKKKEKNQPILNGILKKEQFSVFRLSLDKYPIGIYYYKNHKKLNDLYLIHFNYLIGYEKKVQQMKVFQQWLI